MTRPPIPLAHLRAIALHAQALDQPPVAAPGRDTIYTLIERLGWVQIDTLQMVARSQYLVLHSRLGPYDPADLDALLFDPADRRLYEYWLKAASIIPLKYYRYSLPKMRAYRAHDNNRWQRWLDHHQNQLTVEYVRARIADEGGLRAADFERAGPRRGSWWDWKPAKMALEYLYDSGEVMIANRVNFQRVYDRRERVLPDWVDTTEPTHEEMVRFRLEMAVRALGVCQPMQAAEYAYLGRSQVRPALADMIAAGVLVEVEGELLGGGVAALVIHRDNLEWLERAGDGALTPAHTAFLSPFDSLFWARGRDEELWNFRNVLEAYKREPDRIYGYFSLPILQRDRLIGRMDPKLERRTGTLRIKALHLEPGIAPDEQCIADVAAALMEFLKFHGASNVVLEGRGDADFQQKLEAAL